MALMNVHFATVRCRHQYSCLRKMISSPDSLKWKDIELYIVKYPENPACQTLLIRVKHRLNKGKRNKGIAPVFMYTERNDNLGLYIIQDILEFAFRDDTFASKYIKEPRDVWRYTHVLNHQLGTPIHFKVEVQEIPVFRRVVKLDGSKDLSSLYKYHKGAAANLRHLDKHSRNIIIGHSRSHTFVYYIQVQDNTQSAFINTPTRDALIKLVTNLNLTRDASVPQHLSNKKKQEIKNCIVEGNYKRQSLTFELDISHIIPERKALVDLEFKNRDIDKISDAKLFEDCIQSLEMRLGLYYLGVPKILHFETHNLKSKFPNGRTCDYPGCEEVFYTLPKYKLYLDMVHKISL
ncbi:hypothetical protein BDV32DRAFT_143040 [Aspergillus pseudonomiae]|uniref:Uncharacterized protein n=1 Tax=Aspergillus pseudonomiae TaxID=1506151 RepID=A0A5N6HIC0_9EURO|nr:uncharacterized protein BDV37DRAFT_276485 [Aspergillus pseudonomiae]KAB8254281.1 hypothetical protein BDV32DRAFT_143040 [Aspergillus pseudonomiae]KAE8398015.1 hypothetical protein BDV37DRAFT_276485 [Aspergillus pseudonomiae]